MRIRTTLTVVLLVAAPAVSGCGSDRTPRSAEPGTLLATGKTTQQLARAVEVAIKAHSVIRVDARNAACRLRPGFTPDLTGGDRSVPFLCRVRTQESKLVFFDCSALPSGTVSWCVEDDAPPGMHLFTTPRLRAAPKEVSWKCEDQDAAGHDIGPAFISLRRDLSYPAEQTEWMTKEAARRLARRLHAPFSVDC